MTSRRLSYIGLSMIDTGWELRECFIKKLIIFITMWQRYNRI